MYITKKYLSRRTLLRGMGVSLALPLLDSMVPAQTPLSKTAANPKTRLACMEIVHGAAGSTVEGTNKHYWSPAKEGADFEFGADSEADGAASGLRDHRHRHGSDSCDLLVALRRGSRPFPLQFAHI